MIHVYVAGPYTKGDVVVNVAEAIKVGDRLMELGYIPFIPHFTHFWHFLHHRPWEDWIKYDAEWVKRCDALLRIPGESTGADIEVKQAEGLEIPVFYSLEQLLDEMPSE